MNSQIHLSKSDIKFITIFSSILLVALFRFFDAKVFSIDDYHLFYEGVNNPDTIQFSIESGRWFGVLMFKLFNLIIGDGGYTGIIISYISVCVQFIFCAYLLAKTYQINTSLWYMPVVMSLGFIHVFNAEILTFKIGLMINIGYTFMYAISFYSWYLMQKFDRKFLFALVGIILSLAAYQVIINALIVITLLGFIIELSTWPKNEQVTFKKLIKNPFTIKLSGIVLGTIFYLIINKAVLVTMGLQSSSRSQFIAIADFTSRLNDIYILFKSVLYDVDSFLIPQFIKLLFLGILLICLILIVKNNIFKFRAVYQKLLFVLATLVLLTISLMSTAASGLFLKIWWMVPRMFTGFGLFTLLVFMIAFLLNKSAIVHKLLLLVLMLTVISHINLNHQVANDQAYLNFLDRNKAQRMICELEQIEGFRNKRLYIHQRSDCWVNGYNIKTNIGDMNLSAFCASWSKYKLLQHVSGYHFTPTSPTDNHYLDSLYQTFPEGEKPLWPNNNGIWFNDSLIAVFP